MAVLYLNPTIHNPTTTTIPLSRRQGLADIALRYSIPIIEDDAYTMLCDDPVTPFADLAPELTYYITGTAKCFGPGLRSAFLHAPGKRQTQRISGAMRALSVMSSPLTDALVSTWIADGTADAMLKAVRTEGSARLKLAEHYLGRNHISGAAGAFHLWLKLPKASNWNPSELAVHLRSLVLAQLLVPLLVPTIIPPTHCVSAMADTISRDNWEEGLQQLADVIEQPAFLLSNTH